MERGRWDLHEAPFFETREAPTHASHPKDTRGSSKVRALNPWPVLDPIGFGGPLRVR